MNLAPAHWIWFPSGRTLPNTFVLFRRELNLPAKVRKAGGWITADSRYLFSVNGTRIQFGPAPFDPRTQDVDPVDFTRALQAGANVLGAEVLYYGTGEGTWPGGKPGLICNFKIECEDGSVHEIISGPEWSCFLDRAHRPGQFKRWYLRSLQEEFDARIHPHGWNKNGFKPDERWTAAMNLNCKADQPSITSRYPDYFNDMSGGSKGELLEREIPALIETPVFPAKLAASGKVDWQRDPNDWFEFHTPNAFNIERDVTPLSAKDGTWVIPKSKHPLAHYLTFEFTEQFIGWPFFTIDAPEGTIVEVMTHEAHDPVKTPWLDSHFHSWTRYICRKGMNVFQNFDYESLRWMQLHIRNNDGSVKISRVGVLRRQFPFPNEPRVRVSEESLQHLFGACINTMRNCAQETCVDGMGRERQQYGADCGHLHHGLRYVFGENRLTRRFLRTLSEGQTLDGYFMDCWPAYDRLNRIGQRQIGITPWGPLLDQNVGLAFDTWNYMFESGDMSIAQIVYPRLLKFVAYLERIRTDNGLLPVENLGVPTVWMDHDAYKKPPHKQCSFNLYIAAMYSRVLAPMAREMKDAANAERFEKLGSEILEKVVAKFWDPQRGIFLINRPWLTEDNGPRFCDRSLAMAILFDQCPDKNSAASLKMLAESPPEMGRSYVTNAGWRYWALARHGYVNVALDEFRKNWATLPSVLQNNTIQETWIVKPDTGHQWSHTGIVPLYLLFMDIAGIRPLAPGFARYQVRPQMGNLLHLELTAHTPQGPLEFSATPLKAGGHKFIITPPPKGEGELLLPKSAEAELGKLEPDTTFNLNRFRLVPGKKCEFTIPQ